MRFSGIFRLFFIGLLVAASSSIAVPRVAAESAYTVTDIGTLVGTSKGQFDLLVDSVGLDFNENGQVIANAEGRTLEGNYWSVPFTFDDGKLRRLGKEKSVSHAADINDNGVVVGFATSLDDYFGEHKQAVVWRERKLVELPTLGGESSEAMALNNDGDIVGHSTLSSGSFSIHAVLWQDDQVIDLGTLDGGSSVASDINESGSIVGASVALDAAAVPFLWEDGTMEQLTLPEGIISGGVYSINDDGAIVGSGKTGETNDDGSEQTRAIRWENGEPELLAPLNEIGHGTANEINSAGQVVGWQLLLAEQGGYGTAVVWEDGTVKNLNDVIPENSGFVLYNAEAINDAGQILVAAIPSAEDDSSFHGLLLSPVDASAAHVSVAFVPVPGAVRAS